MRDHEDVAPDIVGFGALNIDYIASASKLSARLTEPVAEWTARFDWNVESPVRREIISRVIDQIGASSLAGSLGGSAWNVIFGLAHMQVNLRLGYVGMVGRAEYPGLSFLTQMDSWGIDRRFVAQNPDDSCGLCLSYIEDGERIMLTYPGANLAMARHIRANAEPLAAYLASARFVHVTSFLDPDTPAEMLRVLTRARELRPRMRIVFDPGHDWAAHPTEPIRGLLRLADYLLLTYREFKALGEHGHGEPDSAVAARILRRCASDTRIIVTKRYDVIDMFQARPDGVVGHRFTGAPGALAEDIEDTTGAGDAFAAGLLAGLASPRLQVELGACLGLSLARHTMRHRPFEGHAALPDLTRGFLQSDERPHRTPLPPAGVFIAHGEDRQWETVRRFLEQECGVPVFALSPDARDGELGDQLRHHLSRCGFAVCLLTSSGGFAEDRMADQRLVHQAGILQGRYGFARVAMLVEEGCRVFSNVAGLIRFDFPVGHVEATFWQLERMLRREGLPPPAYR